MSVDFSVPVMETRAVASQQTGQLKSDQRRSAKIERRIQNEAVVGAETIKMIKMRAWAAMKIKAAQRKMQISSFIWGAKRPL